ncbi:MAG: NnrS family protein, partial [Planctomycetota bacterium]
WYHLIIINGFLLLTLIIAARVATAHAGHRQRLEEREGRWLWLIMGLVSLGMLSRVGAVWSPGSYERHLIYASACVLIAIAIWVVRYGPLLAQRPATT